jgi:UDP-3-O-[3-hydroxymyristoyl] N-acetylglucosamine deacetylase
MGALQGLQRNGASGRRGHARSGVAAGAGGTAAQRTLKHAIQCSGVGLHTGARVSMTLHPAEPGHGVVMRRRDLPGRPELAATWRNGRRTPLCTTLERDGVQIGTIEHLMSALAGCEIDNVLVDLDGPEVPIMDGSAAPFVFLIECAGIVRQDAPRRAIKVLKPVGVEDGTRRARLTPGPGLSIDFEIDFDSAIVARQSWSSPITRAQFKAELARARTFGFLHEVDQLRENGLARGGSLNNAVVISDDGVLNAGGLRYPDEFVRHKVLDVVGDLYLAGAPVQGAFSGIRSGHAMNLQLLQALFADPTAWAWTPAAEGDAGAAERDGAAAPPARAVAQRA